MAISAPCMDWSAPTTTSMPEVVTRMSCMAASPTSGPRYWPSPSATTVTDVPATDSSQPARTASSRGMPRMP